MEKSEKDLKGFSAVTSVGRAKNIGGMCPNHWIQVDFPSTCSNVVHLNK